MQESPLASEKPRSDFPGGKVLRQEEEGSDSCSLND